MADSKKIIKRTGSADNERVQLNKALGGIDETLGRSSEWDAAFGWGDHRDAGYQVALTETQQFENLGVPSELQAVLSATVTKNGTEENLIEVSWKRILDNDIVYDLEIRKAQFEDSLENATLYSVPIVANDIDRARIVYTDSFTGDRTYFFRVRIRRDRLVSPWSDFVSVDVPLNVVVPPAPTNLTGEPLPASAQISWEYDYDNNPTVDSIQIERDGNIIDSIARPATTFKDGVLPIGTAVNYRVRAATYNNVVSAFSNTFTVTPVDITFGTPPVPTGLTLRSEIITNNTGGQIGRVIAEWNRISNNDITYDIEIIRDPNGAAEILETPVISNPDTGKPHYEWIGNINDNFSVRVRSRNATAVSGYTAPALISVIPDANAPGDITGVTVLPLYQGALLRWTNPPSANYFSARIERKRVEPTVGNFVEIARVTRPISFLFDDVGELTIDSDPESGTFENVLDRYQYRITPITSAGQFGNSVLSPEVTPSNIPDDTITASQIVARSITADRIEANSLTAGEINVGSLTADSAFIGGVQQNSILNLIIRSDTAPLHRTPPFDASVPVQDREPLKVGDTWIDTNDGDRPHTWSGTAWIRAYTAITGGDLVTGTITANEINISQVTPFIVDEGNLTGEDEVNVTIRVAVPPDPIPSQRPSGGPIRAGDVWINTADGDRPHTYDGRSPYSDNGWIRAYTSITGGDIETGTITANNINVNDLVVEGNLLITGSDISRLNNDANYTNRDQVNVTIRSDTEPSTRAPEGTGDPLVAGDIWIKTGIDPNTSLPFGDLPHTWDGSQWVRSYTSIDGGNIITGTVDANRIDVSGVITAGSILVGGTNPSNISELNNNLGFTSFDEFDVQDAIQNNVTLIDGSKITTGTIDASQVNVTNINADNITAGTIDADRLAATVLLVGADITELTNNAGFTNFDATNVEAAIQNNVTVIDGSKITTGTIDAAQVNVTNINADNITAGTIDADRLAATVLLVGADITELTNNAGFTNFDATNVEAAIQNNVTVIDGGKITTGTIDAAQVNVTNINADNITAGTIDTDRLATTVLLVGANISELNNDANFTDFNADNVEAAIENNVTTINGAKITTGTVAAAFLDIQGIINDGGIATDGTVNVTIRSATEPTERPNGSALRSGDVWINIASGQGNRPSTYSAGPGVWIPMYTQIEGGNIITGTITAAQIDVSNLAADTAFIDELTVNKLITGSVSTTIRRVEITPATGTDYVIWAGSNAKTDANGIFWVKADGTAKIDKQTFDISDGNLVVGIFSASDSGTGQGSTNTLTATSADITTSGSGVKFDVNFQFTGVIQTLQTTSCAAPAVTGTIQLQRRVAPSGSWTTVDSATINPLGSATYVPTNEAGLAPGVCTANVIADLIKSFVDTPSAGTYNYRVLFSSWFSPFTTAQIDKNEFRVAFTLTE